MSAIIRALSDPFIGGNHAEQRQHRSCAHCAFPGDKALPRPFPDRVPAVPFRVSVAGRIERRTSINEIETDRHRKPLWRKELVLDDGTRRALAPDDVGYVFATPILPDFLTGYEFVRFYMDVNAARIRDGRSADDYFDMVQIAPEDRHRLIKGYSHGMKNKVQMLCFLIARPPVILLDEPLTSFDVVVALEIKQLLRQIKHEHIIVFSTHILQLATDLCDEITVLHEGMLSQLDHALLHSGDFEAQLIELLKDEGEA